jgi:hypothetical protein
MAEAMPPVHASTGITTAQRDGEEDRLSEELRPDLRLCRAKGATEADLGAAFQKASQGRPAAGVFSSWLLPRVVMALTTVLCRAGWSLLHPLDVS